jgi:hypothetical protein
LKLWLGLLALAETNAYLVYVKHKKYTAETYIHPDLKADLEEDFLKRAQEGDASSEEATGSEQDGQMIVRLLGAPSGTARGCPWLAGSCRSRH